MTVSPEVSRALARISTEAQARAYAPPFSHATPEPRWFAAMNFACDAGEERVIENEDDRVVAEIRSRPDLYALIREAADARARAALRIE